MKKIALFLLLATPIHAQTINVRLTDGAHKWYEPLPVKHRTADKTFISAIIVSDGLSVADIQYSLYRLKQNPQDYEINPLFGRRPSALRYYSIVAPLDGLSNYLTWRWKREDDALRDSGIQGHKYAKWHVLNDIAIGVHVFDISLMAFHGGRL